jgi:hypothetical protein
MLMKALMAIFFILFIAIANASVLYNECDCNKNLYRYAMKIGHNSFQQCSENSLSDLYFVGNEPGPMGHPEKAPYRQFFISGNSEKFTAKAVTRGNCTGGDVLSTVTFNDTGLLTLNFTAGKTYRAISQQFDPENNNRTLRLVAWYSAYGFTDWKAFLDDINQETYKPKLIPL